MHRLTQAARSILFSGIFFGMTGVAQLMAQSPGIAKDSLVDVVELRDGSRLVGRIVRWVYDQGLDLVLITGATVAIPKKDIRNVTQQTAFSDHLAIFQTYGYGANARQAYSFREKGIYQRTSFFFNAAASGGAGLNYSIGYRFRRWIGAGMGIGFGSNDLAQSRRLVPCYAEAIGFFLARRITPYYGLRLGYAFALRDRATGLTAARGGLGFGPELGVRFGSRSVNVQLGIEYNWQKASWTSTGWGWDGQGTFTDEVTYKRINFRTGLLF